MPIIHFAPLRLRAGSVVEPGNWGRLLRTHETFKTNDNKALATGAVAREYIFETERLKNFSHLPSRLSSCFACPTLADADLYQPNAGNYWVRHEVEPDDPSAPSHIGYLAYCTMNLAGPFLPDMTAKAASYWAGTLGDPQQGKEVVYGCGLRIVKCLE